MDLVSQLCALLLILGALFAHAWCRRRERSRVFFALFGLTLVGRGHRDYRKLVLRVDDILYYYAGFARGAIVDLERLEEQTARHAVLREEVLVATRRTEEAKEHFWKRFRAAEHAGFPLRYMVQSTALDGAPVLMFARRTRLRRSLKPGDRWHADVTAYYPHFAQLDVANVMDA